MKKRHCYVCQIKPAKKLASGYVNATEEAIFCSLRCAADWALLWVGQLDEPVWCEEHGQWGTVNNKHGCDQCDAEHEDGR